ncbi:MAG: T9SS type A sorting domain-containing protein [Bacteroidia bacterium]
MKKLLLLLLISFVEQINGQTWQWAKSGNGTGIGSTSNEGYSVATDTSGNVFITGFFESPTITFGTYTLSTMGYFDVFIVKYDSNGNVLWAKSAGGSLEDDGYSVSTDKAGNVFLAGYFKSSTITFGTYTLTNTSSNNMNLFIVKYDPNGNVLWAKNPTGTVEYAGNNIVSTDSTGNIFVTGSFLSPTMTLGTYTLTNASAFGSPNVFIAKYDSNGNVLWAKSAGGINGTEGSAVSTDVAGNAFITGGFVDTTVTFGTYTLTNHVLYHSDIFVAKYDANGNVLWAKSAGGITNEGANSISADGGGNVFITGSFNSPTITFGSYTLTNANNTGTDNNFFIAKYDATGSVLWAKSAGGKHGDYGYSVSADINGNAFVTGGFYVDTLTFGSFNISPPANSVDPIYIVKYDSIGNVLCASVLSSGGDDQNGVCTDRFGNAYICSDYQAPSPFVVGTTSLTITHGGENIFVAKWIPNCAKVGVEQMVEHNDKIILYPNPASDQFYIETGAMEKLYVELFDVNGKLLFSKTVNDKSNINVSNLVDGVYTLTIKSFQGITNKKVVVVR